MPNDLGADRDDPIIPRPTTAALVGKRMPAATEVMAEFLPPHFAGGDPVHILVMLFVAAEEQREVRREDLAPPAMLAGHLLQRWIAALEAEGWLEMQGTLAMLTPSAHSTLSRMVRAIDEAQGRFNIEGR